MLIQHYYYHKLAKVSFYKYGNGKKSMLCLHGFGMHGRQFSILEKYIGNDYTLYGIDLFFHNNTVLHNNNLENIKSGISQKEFAEFISDFCLSQKIDKFSLLSYSLGTIYATVLMHRLAHRIEESILIAPICLKINPLMLFFAKNKIGNKLLEKLSLSDNGLYNLLLLAKKIKILDDTSTEILWKEVATPELRFNMYANFTYLKNFDVDIEEVSKIVNQFRMPTYFIFGKKDHSISPKYADRVKHKFRNAKVKILNADHDLVNDKLTTDILFCHS